MILILRFFKQKGFFIFLFIPTGFRMLCSNVKPNITTYYLTPCCMCSQQHKVIRTVGAKSARAPPDFCISVNPISTREQIIPTTLLLAPPPWIFRPSYGPESSGKARVFVLNFQYVIFPSRSPSPQMTSFYANFCFTDAE